MATPAPLDTDEGQRRHAIITNLLTLYTRRKAEINRTFAADARSMQHSTRLERDLDRAAAPWPCRPGPDSISDLVALVAAAASARRRPAAAFWLSCCVAVPLFAVSRPRAWADGAYWLMVLLGRTWRAGRERARAAEEARRELGREVRRELGCGAREAEGVVARIVVAGEVACVLELLGAWLGREGRGFDVL